VEARLIYFASCPNWREARERLGEAIEQAGIGALSVVVRCVITHREAIVSGLCGSPTILIDGRDPFAGPDMRAGIYCRSFDTEAGPDGAPSVTQLVAVLRRAWEDGLPPGGAPAVLLPALDLAGPLTRIASATQLSRAPAVGRSQPSAGPHPHPVSTRRPPTERGNDGTVLQRVCGAPPPTTSRIGHNAAQASVPVRAGDRVGPLGGSIIANVDGHGSRTSGRPPAQGDADECP
jgi:hypothetical protein